MRVDLIFADANVLFSRTLRDWTLMLGMECRRFAVVSSRDCLVETIANIRERNPEAPGAMISHIHDLIEGSLHDLITDYPGGPIEGMPDEKDWHVVHAAHEAQVKILVTENMKDFAPVAHLLKFDLYCPDDLFELVWENDPAAVEELTKKQIRFWRSEGERYAAEGKPAPKGLAEALRGAAAPRFADIVEQVVRKLGGPDDDDPPASWPLAS